MTDILDISRALADVVAASEAGLVLVRGGRSTAVSGTAFGPDLVVTAAEHVERESDIEVTTAADAVPATFVGADPASGIALLRTSSPLRAFEFADSAALRVGELVLALARTASGGCPEARASTATSRAT
jgi:S1-C subfamily serine protease